LNDLFAVIPAPDYDFRGQAPAGIQMFKKLWIPGQARNDSFSLFVILSEAKDLLMSDSRDPSLRLSALPTAGRRQAGSE